jgi:hypothetical protein
MKPGVAAEIFSIPQQRHSHRPTCACESGGHDESVAAIVPGAA